MSKRILVTGISGFISSLLIPELEKEGYEVFGIDNRIPENSPSNFIQADITDYKQLEKVQAADLLIHTAAIAAPNICNEKPQLAYNVNVLGTYNICRWAVTHDIKKTLFISSAHVYGISPRLLPTPEDTPLMLQWDIYTSSKIIGERIVEQCYSTYNLPYTTIRLFNSYGPAQTQDYFIPKKIAEAQNGDIVLRGAATTKDFIYLDDTINALLLALRSNYVGALNIGSGKQYTLKEVSERIVQEYGHKVILDSYQPPITMMQASIDRARNILNWSPQVTFEEGMRRTLGYYKSK